MNLVWLLVLWCARLLAAGATPPDAGRPPLYPVAFGQRHVFQSRQTLSVTKSEPEMRPGDLRPLVSTESEQFLYEYTFLDGTPLDGLPLFLRYRDGHGERGIGMGWRLLFAFSFPSRRVEADIASPEQISYAKFPDGTTVSVSSEAMAVREEGEGGSILVAEQELGGTRYAFRRIGTEVVPLRITRPGREITLQYDTSGDFPLLESIATAGCRLLFDHRPFDDQGDAASRISLLTGMRLTCESGPSRQWSFSYEREAVRGDYFLTRVAIHGDERGEGALAFSHRFMEGERPETTDWCSPDVPAGSVWKPEKSTDNQGRWVLPDGKSIHASPGLRFVKLNSDVHLDLVDAGVNRASWRWNHALRKWERQIYEPAMSVIRGRRPAGTVYHDLWKDFPDDRFNTTPYLSMITSSYEPAGDGKTLIYRSAVFFPRVFNGVLRPDGSGNMWEEVGDKRLILPVPLQYEGLQAWPRHVPGISAEESYRNQGAQFVRFTDDGSPNLLYVGLRYSDAKTGQVFVRELAPHRDTANCRPWREETWEQLGTVRRVKVDICQGFWSGHDSYWSDDMVPEGKSFWKRLDLDDRGRASGRYILPWKDQHPAYYHHYVGFRDVKFCALDRGRTFMIVHASGPSGRVRDLYRLRGDHWIAVPEDSRYYPPREVLESGEVLFVDVNADRVDDAIIPRGPRKGTYVNVGKSRPHWKRCPAFEIPWQADLMEGKAQFVDLNGDEAQDLFIANGSLVFLNRSISTAGRAAHRMTRFTDEMGRQRLVEEVRETQAPRTREPAPAR